MLCTLMPLVHTCMQVICMLIHTREGLCPPEGGFLGWTVREMMVLKAQLARLPEPW